MTSLPAAPAVLGALQRGGPDLVYVVWIAGKRFRYHAAVRAKSAAAPPGGATP